MAQNSSIEWTDATWNPVTGCSVVSLGCTNCYAMGLAGTRLQHHPSRAGLTRPSKAGPVWNGQVRLNEEWLTQPLQWKRSRMIFVCAHGDLFHESVPDAWIDRVFAVMKMAPHHTFQILTKRSARMLAYFEVRRVGDPWAEAADDIADRIGLEDHPAVLEPRDLPLPNVWLGVSAEDQRRADERVPDLLATPAAVRFVSAEPLLGPIDFAPYLAPTGYTLGNPIAYEQGLSEMAGALDKAIGGAYFATADAAASALENGRLPRAWFPDRDLPGRVYELRGGQHDGTRCPAGAARLTACARIARIGSPFLNWTIAGGESGPNARPMHPAWARSIRDQCAAAGVAFHFKQHGAWAPSPSMVDGLGVGGIVLWPNGDQGYGDEDRCGGRGVAMVRVGKKAAGRLLDGVEHNGMPKVRI